MFARIMKLNVLHTIKLICSSAFESVLYYAFWCAAYLFANYYKFDFISMTLGFIVCFGLSFVDTVRRSISTHKIDNIVVRLLIIAYFATFSEQFYRELIHRMSLENKLPTYFMILFAIAIVLKVVTFVLDWIIRNTLNRMWNANQSDFSLDKVISTKHKKKKKVYSLKKMNIYSMNKIIESE